MKKWVFIVLIVTFVLACSDPGPGAPPLPGSENSAIPVGEVYRALTKVPEGAASWGSLPQNYFGGADDIWFVDVEDESFTEGGESQLFTLNVRFPDGIIWDQAWILKKDKTWRQVALTGDEEKWDGWIKDVATVDLEFPRDEINIDGENLIALFACKDGDELKCSCRPTKNIEYYFGKIVADATDTYEEDDFECTTWNLKDDWSENEYWYTHVFYSTDNPDHNEFACVSVSKKWLGEENEHPCCGDDPEEYTVRHMPVFCDDPDESIWCTDLEQVPENFWEDDSPRECCKSSTHCVFEGECYPERDESKDGVIDTDGNGGADAYCLFSSWYDIDASSTYCEEEGYHNVASGETKPHGEYDLSNVNRHRCCGDDEGEYFVEKTTGFNDACCDSPDDVVLDGVCKSSTPGEIEGPGAAGEQTLITPLIGRVVAIEDDLVFDFSVGESTELSHKGDVRFHWDDGELQATTLGLLESGSTSLKTLLIPGDRKNRCTQDISIDVAESNYHDAIFLMENDESESRVIAGLKTREGHTVKFHFFSQDGIPMMRYVYRGNNEPIPALEDDVWCGVEGPVLQPLSSYNAVDVVDASDGADCSGGAAEQEGVCVTTAEDGRVVTVELAYEGDDIFPIGFDVSSGTIVEVDPQNPGSGTIDVYLTPRDGQLFIESPAAYNEPTGDAYFIHHAYPNFLCDVDIPANLQANPDNGFASTEVRANEIYVISTHEESEAKLRIVQVSARKVTFQYLYDGGNFIAQEREPTSSWCHPEGLLARYPLDESLSSADAQSSIVYNGEISYEEGKYDPALVVPDVGRSIPDNAVFLDQAILDGRNEYTISLWIKPEASTEGGILFIAAPEVWDAKIDWWYEYVDLYNYDDYYYGDGYYDADEWHHIVLVRDEEGIRSIVDGDLDSELLHSEPGPAVVESIVLGARPEDITGTLIAHDSFSGLIDDVRIYNTASVSTAEQETWS